MPWFRRKTGGFTATSGLTSNVCFPRLTAARTRLGSAVQTKGLGSSLCSATKRLMASLQVDDGAEDAMFESLAREFGEEAFNSVEPGAEVGVKWKVQRGWRASQARTFGCL